MNNKKRHKKQNAFFHRFLSKELKRFLEVCTRNGKKKRKEKKQNTHIVPFAQIDDKAERLVSNPLESGSKESLIVFAFNGQVGSSGLCMVVLHKPDQCTYIHVY